MTESLDNLEENEFVFHTPVEKPVVGQYFKKNGHFDGRLFHSPDKLTYTFVSETSEVISLHFDKTRHTIFYQGHDIANIPITQEKWGHLEKFKNAITNNNETKKYIIDYCEILKKVQIDIPATNP